LAEEHDGQGASRHVVLKTMLPELIDSREHLAMFEAEAIVGLMLDHPNLVRIFDCGRLAQRPFIAMEHIDGLNLRQLSKRFHGFERRLPQRLLVTIALDVCRGLHAAHELHDRRGPLQVVHQDISPENIMISPDGTSKLVDFGAAKSRYTPARAPRLAGKLRYLAPERIQPGGPSPTADRRADIYGLGVVLHELLTGVAPFRGSDDAEMIAAVLAGQCRPRRDHVPDLLPRLDQIITRALATAPEQRHATAADLAADLQSLLDDPGLRPGADETRLLLARALASPVSAPAGEVGAVGVEESKTVIMEVGALAAVLDQTRHHDLQDDATVVCNVSTRELLDLVAAPSVPADATAEAASLPPLLAPVAPAWLFEAPAGSAGEDAGPAGGPARATWFDIRRFPARDDDRAADRARPSDAPAGSTASRHFDRGLALVAAKNYDEALQEWEAACALEPGNRTYQVNLKRLRERVARKAHPSLENA
jgi:serine/threonine-protein kinase